MSVRAKFRCSNKTVTQYGPSMDHSYTVYTFEALYDPSVPEDQRFAKATPVGKLTMQVDNPDVSFTPGQAYYIGLVPAEDPAINA